MTKLFEASEARTNFQIYVATITFQQIHIVRDNPIIADNDAVTEGGLKPAASPVHRVPILHYDGFSAHLFWKVPHARAQSPLIIAAT